MEALVDHRLRANAWGDAEKALGKFVVKRLLEGDGYRHFRCRNGKSRIYSFDVMEYGTNLVVTGDMGEWLWQRERCMLSWARGVWKSDKYFAEKLAACRPGDRTEFWPAACEAWLRRAFGEIDDMESEAAVELVDIQDLWRSDGGWQCVHTFHSLLESSKHWHCAGEMPTVERYTYGFHWIQRAIGWLAERVS